MTSSKYGKRPPTLSAHGVKAPVAKAEHKIPIPKMSEEDTEEDEGNDY